MVNSYTNPTLVASELRLTSPFASTTLPSLSDVTNWIVEESAVIDRDMKRSFGSTQNTVDIDITTSNPNGDTITLKYVPILSVNTVLYATDNLGDATYPSWQLKTEDKDYTVYKDSGEISWLPTNFNPGYGRKKVRVIYTSGYSSTPYIVQKLATKLVSKRIIDSAIESNVQTGSFGGSVQVGSIRIVDPAMYGLNGYKMLNDEIRKIYEDMVQVFGVYRYNG